MKNELRDVNIPWGYHTMVKKLEFCGGDFFIGKFVRNDDGMISWHCHEASGKCCTDVGIIVYGKEEDNPDHDKKSLVHMTSKLEDIVHISFATIDF